MSQPIDFHIKQIYQRLGTERCAKAMGVAEKTADAEFYEREMRAMGERWFDIAGGKIERASEYRLCINGKLGNELWDYLEAKYRMTGGRSSAAALAEHIYGLKIVQHDGIEGWQILHISQIPADVLAMWNDGN